MLGVACGSLGALTAVTADELEDALERVAAGDWTERRLPALVVEREGEEDLRAINDLVLVRGGAGQVMVEIEIDGERYIRLAGDGLVAATPLGSTAYTLAAGGPMLAPGALGLVLTPLAPHGGVCPPLVTARGTTVRVILEPGHGGARVELDGQVYDTLAPLTPRDVHAAARAGVRDARLTRRARADDRGPAPPQDPARQPARARARRPRRGGAGAPPRVGVSR